MHYRLNGLWIGILLVFLLSGVNGPAHSQLYLSMVNFQGGGFFPAASLGKALAKPEFLVDSNQNVTNSSPAVYKMGSTLMMSIGLTTGASAYSGTLIISATYTGQGNDSWTLTPSPASISISLPPNSSSTPITLSLAGMPSIVSKGKLSVQFQTSQPPLIRNGQNMSLPNLGFGYTTTIYQVLDTPNAPMSVPWIEVLNYSCIWAYGKSSAADVAQYETTGLFNGSMFTYPANKSANWLDPMNDTIFRLKDYLNATKPAYGNCVDVSDFLLICANSVGLSFQSQRYTSNPPWPSNVGNSFQTTPICAIGSNAANDASYVNYMFGMHQIDNGLSGVYDACAAQYYDLSGNSWKKPIYGWLLNGYWQTQQANNNIVGLVLRPNSVATPLLGNSQPSSIYGPYVPTVQ